jgi:hypothetical protein
LIRDDRQVDIILGPDQAILSLAKTLEFHRELALRNLIIWKHL